MTALLTPFALSHLSLPNRVVMAPMTRVRSTPDGLATPSMASYYAQRSAAGLIISEGIHPSRVGQSNPLTPGLHSDAQVASWHRVTDAVHVNGGRMFAQIMHAGRLSHSDTTGLQPVAPSAVPARVQMFTPSGPQPAPIPRALTTTEVAEESASHASAARRAIDGGFDGVELHGANGYLMSQFLSSNANLRTDRYGGSVTGRISLIIETVEATVAAIGGNRVGLRLSPGAGIQDLRETDVPALYGALLRALAPLDLAYIHLEATTDDSMLLTLRRAWPGTMIMNPSKPESHQQTDREAADRWLGLGADLISFGRAYLANPDLVERLRADLPLAHHDPDTRYQGGDTGYLTYPSYQHSPQP